jgi:CBS domain-containing protein
LRLEALGFEQVADYVAGKQDWFSHALPREGKTASIPYAGDLVDPDPPVCAPSASLADVSALLAGSRYGYCLVLNDERIILGRVRRSAIADAPPRSTAESVMEPGPSTVRPNTPAQELAERLGKQGLKTAVVATPRGRLIGVFHRERM